MEWLEAFFDENGADLDYFGLPSVEDAVSQTMDDAEELFEVIQELADEAGGLDKAFINLDDHEYRVVQLSKKKAKGLRRKSWLRIYAIKVDTDVFLITGGAIKLTHQMQDREHTKKELIKLEQCRNYLRENDISDEDSFRELAI
ncbi:hypothetical protein SAMN05216436_105213 [bacterium A37T11]|nr:hypothetical protein SAMN05216436_105213 [bacterium A37T11]